MISYITNGFTNRVSSDTSLPTMNCRNDDDDDDDDDDHVIVGRRDEHDNRVGIICSNDDDHDMEGESENDAQYRSSGGRPIEATNYETEDHSHSPTNVATISHRKVTRLQQFYIDHCIYLPAMLGWFLFSAALSSYNKFVFGKYHGAFPCPLLLTSVHFLAQWLFSYVISSIFPTICGTERIRNMTWKEWISVSIPCGFVTSGDVGLSNLSLVTISMTFYTMIKSSTPIFVLMWAYFFGIERISWNLCFVVFIIAVGEVLTVVGEVDFNPIGFTLCLFASILSGARWTLVQLKLRQMDPPLKTTIATMRLLSPSMFWSMLLVSLYVEHPWIKLRDRPVHETLYDLFGLGMAGAILAISMILCEFWLIMKANAIVLMIGGVVKEMITIFVGVMFFGDELNSLNLSGCFVVFVGVLYYKMTHLWDSKQHHPNQQHHRRLNDNDEEEDEEDDSSRGNNQRTIRLDRPSLSPRPGRVILRTNLGGSDGLVIYTKVDADSDHMRNLDDSYGSGGVSNGGTRSLIINKRLSNRKNSRSLETGESTSELSSNAPRIVINSGKDIC